MSDGMARRLQLQQGLEEAFPVPRFLTERFFTCTAPAALLQRSQAKVQQSVDLLAQVLGFAF